MFKEFNLLSIKSVAADKYIDLTFNFDIRVDSVKGDSIIVTRVRDDNHIPYKMTVKNDLIRLEFDDWFSPNEEYFVIINKEIKNIIGHSLLNTVRRRLVFKTEITNKIKIVSPYMHQKIDTLSFVLEDSEEVPFNNYYIELATENRFYNTVYNAEVTGTEFTLTISPDIRPGQYYVRARAQSGDQYGPWSNIATFIYKEEPEPEFPIDKLGGDAEAPGAFDDFYNAKAEILGGEILDDQAAEEIEVEQDLEILTYPENGITPEDNTFVFEFDKPLDPAVELEIIVIRKDF